MFNIYCSCTPNFKSKTSVNEEILILSSAFKNLAAKMIGGAYIIGLIIIFVTVYGYKKSYIKSKNYHSWTTL